MNPSRRRLPSERVWCEVAHRELNAASRRLVRMGHGVRSRESMALSHMGASDERMRAGPASAGSPRETHVGASPLVLAWGIHGRGPVPRPVVEGAEAVLAKGSVLAQPCRGSADPVGGGRPHSTVPRGVRARTRRVGSDRARLIWGEWAPFLGSGAAGGHTANRPSLPGISLDWRGLLEAQYETRGVSASPVGGLLRTRHESL